MKNNDVFLMTVDKPGSKASPNAWWTKKAPVSSETRVVLAFFIEDSLSDRWLSSGR